MSDHQQDEGVVSRIMEKAATADRQALFAALQAAVGAAVDAELGHPRKGGFAAIEKALDVGAPYGSPEHLASLKREELLGDE